MESTDLLQWKYVVASLVYSGIGMAVLVISFVILDLVTPKVAIWRELCEKQNMALAVFLGAVVLGISIIIASAVHS